MTSPSPSPPPSPVPDLSKLRINRDVPSPTLRRALLQNLALVLGALIIFVGIAIAMRRGRAVPVRTVVATPISGAGAAGAGATSVTANGYVVARTRASVSAKLAGRIAELRVSEGSTLRRGEVIARLENADYQAQLAQADGELSTARAELLEARSERDVLSREEQRLRGVRAQNPEL